MGGRGAGWARRVGRAGSGAGTEGESGVWRVGGKGAWLGVGRACGDCLPGGPGEVVMGRRRGRGPSAEQLQGSGELELGKPGCRGSGRHGQLLW